MRLLFFMKEGNAIFSISSYGAKGRYMILFSWILCYIILYIKVKRETMKTVFLLFRALRPHQWIKNGFILLPVIFAQPVLDPFNLLIGIQAVAVFCGLTGAVYLLNDYMDREEDRHHPFKRQRPLASGLISPRLALGTAVSLLLISLAGGFYVGRGFFLVLLIYLGVQILYNLWLRDVVILDVFCVAAGFFLRVIAGAVVVSVPMSRWLIICTILIAMFLILSKRRYEVIVLGKIEGEKHRKVLSQYSAHLLDQMIGVTTAGVLLSYLLYCTSPETVQKLRTENMIYTFPFVLYGIFRYLYLIYQKREGGSPERIILSDRPLLASVLLWVVLCVLILNGVL
ncbi:MAG: decaprenyl-phosphate phosphoribosyltransferase [Syntrophobacterales bacterium]|nr:MAG: decaprenyl-phosphate phosphoribosyltransferase [Syntrophobacterales bacterium]